MPSRTFKKLRQLKGALQASGCREAEKCGHGALDRGTVSLYSSVNMHGDQRFLCSLFLMLIF